MTYADIQIKFLKPDWRKISLLIIIFLVSSLYVVNCCPLCKAICESRGFPLPYQICRTTMTQNSYPCSILYFGLIADIAIWYLISCLLIYIYDKIRTKKILQSSALRENTNIKDMDKQYNSVIFHI